MYNPHNTGHALGSAPDTQRTTTSKCKSGGGGGGGCRALIGGKGTQAQSKHSQEEGRRGRTEHRVRPIGGCSLCRSRVREAGGSQGCASIPWSWGSAHHTTAHLSGGAGTCTSSGIRSRQNAQSQTLLTGLSWGLFSPASTE